MNLLGQGNPEFTALIKCFIPISEFLGENNEKFIQSLNCLNKRIYSKNVEIRIRKYKQRLDFFEQFSPDEGDNLNMNNYVNIRTFLKGLHSNFLACRGKDVINTEFLVNLFLNNNEKIEVNKFNLVNIVSFYFNLKITNENLNERFIRFIIKEENFSKFKTLLSKKLKDTFNKKINKHTIKEILELKFCRNEYREYVEKYSK